jgi:hypothetical protein
MSWLTEHQRLIGRCAWVAAWVGLVVGQLHALSRFATTEGAEDLTLPATAAWAVPAVKALSPLLGWGDADLVMSPMARSGSPCSSLSPCVRS